MDKVIDIWYDLKTRYILGDLSRVLDLVMYASILS